MQKGTIQEVMREHDFVLRDTQKNEEALTREGTCDCCHARLVIQYDTRDADEVTSVRWAYINWRNGKTSSWNMIAECPTPEEARQWPTW